MFDIGDPVTFGIEVRDTNGTLVNSAPVTYVLTKPDGSATGATSASNPSTGVYTGSYTADTAGRYSAKFTVGGTYAGVYATDFFVRTGLGGIVSLDEVKAQLNWVGGSNPATEDDELLHFIDVVSDYAEARLGPLRRQAIVATLSGGTESLALPLVPVISVTTVKESGVTLSASDYDLNKASGIITRLVAPYTTRCWASGFRNVEVTYVGGYASIPEHFRQGALLLVAHLWETQRGTFGAARAGADDTMIPGTSYTVPNRVAEFWQPAPTYGFS